MVWSPHAYLYAGSASSSHVGPNRSEIRTKSCRVPAIARTPYVRAANFVAQQIGGLVVADDDHQRDQVFDGGLQAGIERVEDPGGKLAVAGLQRDAIGQRKFSASLWCNTSAAMASLMTLKVS